MHPNSTITYGFEIRSLEQLTPLLQHHPTFDHFAENLQHGIDYTLMFEHFSFTENLQNGSDYPLKDIPRCRPCRPNRQYRLPRRPSLADPAINAAGPDVLVINAAGLVHPAINTVGPVGPLHSRNYTSSTSQCTDP